MQSPLLGFNNNVKHKGRIFHVQTEDSGIKHPHVITHLFTDGGRLLKTTKTSYADHLGAEFLEDTVRTLMRDQHKAMFIALRDGQLDHLFEDAPPSSRSAASPEKPKKSHRPPARAEAPDPFALAPADAAIESATQAEARKTRPPSRPKKSDRPGRKSDAPRAAEKSARRYASTRPAAVFATPRTSAAGKSIFGGDDLISEKSLDEVILSYLAEDLEGSASKK
jgi:hypothetical protein